MIFTFFFSEQERTRRNTRDDQLRYINGHFAQIINHLRALLVKRFIYMRRNQKGIISQIVLPAVFVSIAMTVALSAPSVDDLPPLVLDPAQYYNVTWPRGNFITFANRNPNVKFNSSSTDAKSSQLIETFHLPSGVGATCLLKAPFNSSFDHDAAIELRSHPRSFELLSRYFNEECRSVFQPGIHLDNYIPDADVIHNASWYGKYLSCNLKKYTFQWFL